MGHLVSIAVASISVLLARKIGISSNTTDMILTGFFGDCSEQQLPTDMVSTDIIGRVNVP